MLCRILLALSAALPLAVARAQPSSDKIGLELNKLEPLPAAAGGSAGCRAWLVASNPAGEPLEGLQLDLVLFGTDGVIARRLVVEAGALARGRTSVRPFDMPGQACDGIGRVLVNDVLACRGSGGAALERAACLERIAPTSRVATSPLSK